MRKALTKYLSQLLASKQEPERIEPTLDVDGPEASPVCATPDASPVLPDAPWPDVEFSFLHFGLPVVVDAFEREDGSGWVGSSVTWMEGTPYRMVWNETLPTRAHALAWAGDRTRVSIDQAFGRPEEIFIH